MDQILHLINEMSPYLLLGFFLAGLMHAFIPGTVYSKYLSASNFRSVLLAALFGIPLPLCSCGVIPTAMSLRREGASKGATTSFLIATPQTGVDSIIATFSLMGLPFAIVRPIAALLTALFGGQMVNMVDERPTTALQVQEDPNPVLPLGRELQEGSVRLGDSCLCESNESAHEHNHGHCACTDSHEETSVMGRMKVALRYAFLDMMEDIGKWLVVGLIIAGLITVFVPDSFFEVFKDNSLLSILLVLCLAVPMYLCDTGSIPIAVALMLKGLTPGAGLVMLMAGPACNMASILVINKVMGRRTLITYLASIITGAVSFGLIIDHLLPREWFISSLVAQDGCCMEEPSTFSWCCTALLFLLLANAMWHHYFGKTPHTHTHTHQNHQTTNPLGSKRRLPEQEPNNQTTIMTYTIKGMNCNHCRMSAEKALLACEGVTSASVDLASATATVEGNYDVESLRNAIDSIGFTFVDNN